VWRSRRRAGGRKERGGADREDFEAGSGAHRRLLSTLTWNCLTNHSSNFIFPLGSGNRLACAGLRGRGRVRPAVPAFLSSSVTSLTANLGSSTYMSLAFRSEVGQSEYSDASDKSMAVSKATAHSKCKRHLQRPDTRASKALSDKLANLPKTRRCLTRCFLCSADCWCALL
jgi:hypothetical protein